MWWGNVRNWVVTAAGTGIEGREKTSEVQEKPKGTVGRMSKGAADRTR